DRGTMRVRHVQERPDGLQAEAVRLLEVADEKLRIAAVSRDPVDALETEVALALDAEDRHAPVPRVAEVDRTVVCDDHIVGAVQLLALVVRSEGLAITPRAVGVHADE